MIHIRLVNKCRHFGMKHMTPTATTAKCTGCSLLMHDVNSKKNATRALAIMANTAEVQPKGSQEPSCHHAGLVVHQ